MLLNRMSLRSTAAVGAATLVAGATFAVTAFAEVLYHENRGKGVRFACVCPPVVATPLLEQMGRAARGMVDASAKIQPEEVVDAIEDALERGRFLVFPGRGTSVAGRLRRILPGLLWRRIHQLTPLG